MAYVDFEFYKTKFYGDIVPEESFQKYAEIASDRIDRITFDRLVYGLPENERDKTKVQKAVCAVADALYQIDQIRRSNMETVGTVKNEDGTVTGKMVSSVSSGSESISYQIGLLGTEMERYAKAALDEKEENLIIREKASNYIYNVISKKGVYLLYAGVR